MYGSIAVGTRSIHEYEPVVGAHAIERLIALAEPLRAARILHLSSPAAPGSVRSVLQTAVPLMLSLGLNVHWQQLRMPTEFIEVDRHLRSALSGEAAYWTTEHTAQWAAFNHMNAQLFDEEYDLVVVHHTASVGLYKAIGEVRGTPPAGRWVWHSHRNYRQALPEVWGLISQNASSLHGAFFDLPQFLREDVPVRLKAVVPPGVDAVGARTAPVAKEMEDALLSQRGIDPGRPVIAQIISSTRPESPMAVLESFEMVRHQRPDAQLVVVNLAFTGGAELRRTIDAVTARAERIGNILHLTELDKVGAIEIAALRQEAEVMIHQGLPQGISMELLEEMWQSRPVVSASSPMAIACLGNGLTGVIADDPTEQAQSILRLLDSPREAERLGRAAHRVVATRYLPIHHLKAFLQAARRLLRGRNARSHVGRRGRTT